MQWKTNLCVFQTIPQGDWFCPECRPKQRSRRLSSRQRSSVDSDEEQGSESEGEEEDEEEEEQTEEEEDDEGESEEEENEDDEERYALTVFHCSEKSQHLFELRL